VTLPKNAMAADDHLTARYLNLIHFTIEPRSRRRSAATVASGEGQETSSRAPLVYAFATSRVKSACAAAALTIQSTFVVPAAFS
jgi:hypothetical protein